MEGISHEAASLAGTWGLNKLIAFWDDNHISIDGNVDGWFTDDTPARFEAYGWNVIRGVDGHDADAIKRAIDTALRSTDKPTLICCRTTIGFGSPDKAGKESSARRAAGQGRNRRHARGSWTGRTRRSRSRRRSATAGAPATPALRARSTSGTSCSTPTPRSIPSSPTNSTRRSRDELPDDFAAAADAYIAKLQADGPVVASRKASQMAIEAFAPLLPELIGGSADLAHSNLTLWKGSKSVASDDADANYIYLRRARVRDDRDQQRPGACTACFIPYDATFLVFSDYARNARAHERADGRARDPRLHARLDRPGRRRPDPPADRAPGLAALHPATTTSGARATRSSRRCAWRAAIERHDGPSCLVFSRQNLRAPAAQRRSRSPTSRAAATCCATASARRELILIATGSEVELAMQAADAARATARARGVDAVDRRVRPPGRRVPRSRCCRTPCRKRVAIEAGVTDFWRKYVGLDGAVIGIDTLRRVGAGRGAVPALRLHRRERGRGGARRWADRRCG